MMKLKDIMECIKIGLIIVLLLISFFQSRQIKDVEEDMQITKKLLDGGNWITLSKKCIEFAEGEEWKEDNCIKFGDTDLRCKIEINGQEYYVPVDDINLDNVKSCRKWIDYAQIYMRGKILEELE